MPTPSVATSSVVVVAASVFLACAVEMVEALTIVVAVGSASSWRRALWGVASALGALAALVAVFGPLLVHVPLTGLRLVVGGVLLVFGLQWLRKSLLRAVGLRARHDEEAIFAQTVAEVESAADARVAFILSFKGVFLEGVEVIVLVLTLGSSSRRLGVAVVAALGALLLVALVGVVIARHLNRVPENLMKMSVGVLLVSYGTFFGGEGLRVRWPGDDRALVALVVFYALVTWIANETLRVLVQRERVRAL